MMHADLDFDSDPAFDLAFDLPFYLGLELELGFKSGRLCRAFHVVGSWLRERSIFESFL